MTLAEVAPLDGGAIQVNGDEIAIKQLVVVDADLSRLLHGAGEPEWEAVVRRALSVGARGLTNMGIGIDLTALDERVRQTLETVTHQAERRLASVLEAGKSAMAQELDPNLRSSTVAKIFKEFTAVRDSLFGGIDPAIEGSHTTEFLGRLRELLGPEGALEARLAEALDPDSDSSAFGLLKAWLDGRFLDLRDAMAKQAGFEAGRDAEAEVGTKQGLGFEDLLEESLRSWAAAAGGCIVERTGRTPGALGAQCMVGDFVLSLPGRVAVEAKNQSSIGLAGKDGILAELDRAMANRQAEFAICVSARDAFPAEVGHLDVYGNKVLVVDDGDGILLPVALQLARAHLAASAEVAPELDRTIVSERVAEIRRLAEQLRGARASLTDIRKGTDSLHERLGDLRSELLDRVSDIEAELRGEAPS